MSLLEWLKIWSKFYSLPLFCNTEYPPPPKMKIVRNLGTLTFKLQNNPPPPKMKIVRNLGTLTFKLQNTPPPPPLEFRHFLVLCDFSVAEYPPLEFRHFLVLCDFSVAEYPPPLSGKFIFR